VVARRGVPQVCTELRKAGVAIPIIAMTGNVDPASISLYRSVGFDGILAKPFSKVCAM
jgi:CheY-like chemotaxis protein